jgi:hypothetical protein
VCWYATALLLIRIVGVATAPAPLRDAFEFTPIQVLVFASGAFGPTTGAASTNTPGACWPRRAAMGDGSRCCWWTPTTSCASTTPAAGIG